MFAQVCDLGAGDFVHTLGDAHLYLNHFEQARVQLARRPRRAADQLMLESTRSAGSTTSSWRLHTRAYDPHPGISAPIAVLKHDRRLRARRANGVIGDGTTGNSPWRLFRGLRQFLNLTDGTSR